MPPSVATGSSFRVTVEPSGRSFTVQAGEALLAAALRANISMPYGCRDGACGSCKCKKLSGTVVHGTHQSKALSEQEEAAGLVLTCCAVPHSDVLLESRQVTREDAFPIRKMPARVKQLERLAPDVMRVVLQLPANELFAYHPGQYMEFLLSDGKRRSYSMACAPNITPGGTLELHVRHMPGGVFTDQLFASVKEKDIFRIEGPFGGFYLREDSQKPLILLGSGTGFAPLRAIIERLQGLSSQRDITLYWGARRPHDLYLHGWVQDRLAQMPQLRYVPVVSDALLKDSWSGRTGYVHRAVLQDFSDLSHHQVYACGAPVVVESARAEYARHGLPDHEFFADAFTSAADKSGA